MDIDTDSDSSDDASHYTSYDDDEDDKEEKCNKSEVPKLTPSSDAVAAFCERSFGNFSQTTKKNIAKLLIKTDFFH